MKIAAHPLVVAVALGLVNPAALAEGRGTRGGAPEAPELQRRSAMEHALLPPHGADDLLLENAPSPEEFARIEAAWRALG